MNSTERTPIKENRSYRHLADSEINTLKRQGCSAEAWSDVLVSEHFDAAKVCNVRMSGKIRIGELRGEFTLAGGVKKSSGIRNATLHNVTIGDGCCIENIKNYIANYVIGDRAFIENVDCMIVDRRSAFGNGTEVSVLSETGGREVIIHDKLSAHEAYVAAMFRHRPDLAARMKELVMEYADRIASEYGSVGPDTMIVDTGYIKNVRIGGSCKIESAGRLKNGSINSNASAPVHIGYGVVCDDFIISSGSHIEDGTTLTRCFVGQSCRMGHNYTASDSLFFCNCQEENGEACAIFAGPFTVTHHKSTLLIAGMFSFMNAGSGSNQSNHMYKLGPIHQGIMERGAKTASDSYILWPARIGAFSLVMGRHVAHPDTTNLPFSYLIEEKNTTYLMPGVNLRSVGTIRDAQKWPRRDLRTDPCRMDKVNFNLLSPYTIQKMFKGREILRELARVSGETSETYSYQSAKIKHSSLNKGIRFYETGITKFLGNSVIKRLEITEFGSDEEIRARLKPDTATGTGEWLDVSGLIAPRSEIDRLMADIECGALNSVEQIDARLTEMANNYYAYEWTWAYGKVLEFFGLEADRITAQDITRIVERWKEAVVGLDRLVYEDAKKEFSLSAMTGFGADGTREEQRLDFEHVRGDFESNPFVKAVLEHIETKSALGDELIGRMRKVGR